MSMPAPFARLELHLESREKPLVPEDRAAAEADLALVVDAVAREDQLLPLPSGTSGTRVR
jgi:hypothetical protein